MSRSQNFDFQVCADGLFLSSLFLQLFVSCLVCFEECRWVLSLSLQLKCSYRRVSHLGLTYRIAQMDCCSLSDLLLWLFVSWWAGFEDSPYVFLCGHCECKLEVLQRPCCQTLISTGEYAETFSESQLRRFIAGPTLNNYKKRSRFFFGNYHLLLLNIFNFFLDFFGNYHLMLWKM